MKAKNLKKLHSQTGVALIVVIIYAIVLGSLSAAMLNMLSNQASVIERGISRIKALYAAEAIMVREFEIWRVEQNTALLDPQRMFDWLPGVTKLVDVEHGVYNQAAPLEFNLTLDDYSGLDFGAGY